MLTINLAQDCSRLEVTTDPDLIQAIDDPTSDQCCFRLTLGTNCCTPTTVLPIRAIYPFQVEITDCGTELVEDILTPYIDLTVTGIDAACVTQVTLTNQEGSGVLTFTDLEDMVFRSYVTGPSLIREYDLTITTECDLEYLLEFTVTFDSDICDYILSATTVTYPELPAGVELVDNPEYAMYIYPEAFGQTGDELAAGVYFVGLEEISTEPQTNSIFVDCEVLCKVIDYIAKYPTCNLYTVFEALQLSDSCDTISYAQKCSLWTYLGRRLGYFSSTPCATTSNCKPCKSCKGK